MKTERIAFEVALYKVTGKSFLCPESAPPAGTLVIGFASLKAVDPKNWYAFVNTAEDEVSVSRKFLEKQGKTFYLYIERPPFTTHNQEVSLKLQAMRKYLKGLEVSA
jgi:hypothetical protein